MFALKLDEKYLILSDLDGTLLNNHGRLDKLTINVIKTLVKQSNMFGIITGRPASSSVDIYRQLGLKGLLINFNGASICNPTSKSFKTLNFGFNPSVLIEAIDDDFLKYAKNVIVETNKGVYAYDIPKNKKERDGFYKKFHINIARRGIVKIQNNFKNLKDTEIFAILVQLKDINNVDWFVRLARFRLPTTITRVWRDETYGIVVEINSRFATKGKGLEYFSSYYGVPLSRCITFGDGDNDDEMLKTSGCGFAMKNATMTAKLSAKFITKYDNDNCGVARELINLFKLKGFN